MPYEKYITKDGKVYGPYVYHSKRVDGKVISEYHGQTKQQGKFLWIAGIAAAIIIAAFFISQKSQTTGYSVLGIDATYEENLPLQGSLNFQLREGEFVPADSQVVFESAGEQSSFSLSDIITEEATEGDFFVSGKGLSGSGLGFGIAGEKETAPEVSFTLLIYAPLNGTEDTESESEISGTTSKEETYTYTLKEGERAELKPLSVFIGGQPAEDSQVSVLSEANIVTVSTDYSETEEGYGEAYLGEEISNFKIDLNGLNLTLQPGQLDVYLLHSNETLVSLSTVLGTSPESETDESVESQEPEPEENSVNESANNDTVKEIPVASLQLTLEEQEALDTKFGNTSVEVTEAVEKNGFIRIRYELGDFWIENAYDSDFTNETLKNFIERDNQKFLKDIAKKLVQQQEQEEEVALPA